VAQANVPLDAKGRFTEDLIVCRHAGEVLPITPDKVLKALELKRAGKLARVGPESFPAVPYPDPVVVLPPWEGGDGKAIDQAPTLAGGVREERQH